MAAQVRSPYVAEVIELAPDRQTRLYSVMPFYVGETLEQRLRRSPLALAEGIAIASQLGRAVDALHRRRIVHRDIKPDNVLLLAGGGLRLLDLGVARLPGLESTPDEDIPGTPSYLAPELFEGNAGDERTDVYALGVTLYRMFSGHYPYGETEAFARPRFARRQPLAHYRPGPAGLARFGARARHGGAGRRPLRPRGGPGERSGTRPVRRRRHRAAAPPAAVCAQSAALLAGAVRAAGDRAAGAFGAGLMRLARVVL